MKDLFKNIYNFGSRFVFLAGGEAAKAQPEAEKKSPEKGSESDKESAEAAVNKILSKDLSNKRVEGAKKNEAGLTAKQRQLAVDVFTDLRNATAGSGVDTATLDARIADLKEGIPLTTDELMAKAEKSDINVLMENASKGAPRGLNDVDTAMASLDLNAEQQADKQADMVAAVERGATVIRPRTESEKKTSAIADEYLAGTLGKNTFDQRVADLAASPVTEIANAGKGKMTPEQQARYDSAMASIKKVQDEISGEVAKK